MPPVMLKLRRSFTVCPARSRVTEPAPLVEATLKENACGEPMCGCPSRLNRMRSMALASVAVPTVERGSVPIRCWSTMIAVVSPSSTSTSGRARVGMKPCTNALYVSLISRCDSAAIVPNTSELLPEPETPVNTVSARFGISTLTSLRLLTRAPTTRITFIRSRYPRVRGLRFFIPDRALGPSGGDGDVRLADGRVDVEPGRARRPGRGREHRAGRHADVAAAVQRDLARARGGGDPGRHAGRQPEQELAGGGGGARRRGTVPPGRAIVRSMTSEPLVIDIPVTWPPRRSATVRVVPPARSSCQLTAGLSVIVTAVASVAETLIPPPSTGRAALPPTVASFGGGLPAGVVTRSSVPLGPGFAKSIVSTGGPVSTRRGARECPSAGRLAVCGPGGGGFECQTVRTTAVAQTAMSTTAMVPSTARERHLVKLTMSTIRGRAVQTSTLRPTWIQVRRPDPVRKLKS